MDGNYETLLVTSPAKWVVQVELNRPDRLNAISTKMWTEMRLCFDALSEDSRAGCIVLCARGKHFTAGLDLQEAASAFAVGGGDGDGEGEGEEGGADAARKAMKLRQHILDFQAAFTAISQCRVPVIAAIHGGCIGGGVDIVTACDVRLASRCAFFTVKEVDIGLAADVGSLSRLPKVMGNQSLVRELAFTARRFSAAEALTMGLLSSVSADAAAVRADALTMAATIAAKSPVAIVGTKHLLNYTQDHASTDDSLRYTAAWNASMLNTADIGEGVQATLAKRKPLFSRL